MYDVGTLLLYLSWSGCVAAVVMAANGWSSGREGVGQGVYAADGTPIDAAWHPRLSRRLLAGLLPLSVAASLSLPFVEGTGADGEHLVLSGWAGLDAASVAAVVGTSIVASAVGFRRRDRLTRNIDGGSSAFTPTFLASSVAGVILGNVLILAGWPGESRLHLGGIVVALWSAFVAGFVWVDVRAVRAPD